MKTISAFMTPMPATVGVDQSIAFANRRMHEAGIRHLPVLDGGKLVGLISERDIALIEGLPGCDTEELKVSDAMTIDVFTVKGNASLALTAAVMAERKLGSAIVTERGNVAGIFTTVDALRALAALARERTKKAA